MSDKIRAAEELKRFGRQFRNMLDVVDDLERVGSIENAAAEAEANFNRSKASLESIEHQIQDANLRYQTLLTTESDHIKRIKNEQEESARAAREIVDAANLEAQNIQNNTRVVVEDLKRELEEIRKDIRSSNEMRMSIGKEIESLNQRKEAALAEARKLFGG